MPSSLLKYGYPLRGKQGKIIRSLGMAIVRGKYKPGTFLPTEVQLLKRFAVSRTSLREAIKVLSAKGLLEGIQKLGTRVRTEDHWDLLDPDVFSWHDLSWANDGILLDLIEVRLVVEPSSAGLAATRGTVNDHRKIARAATAMLAAVDDPKKYTHADAIFHSAILSASHNRFLYRFYEIMSMFLEASFRLQQEFSVRTAEDLKRDYEDHATVLRAIEERNGEAAERAMRHVILNGKAALERALEAGIANGP
jgi:GntR family transcriptional regulator, galactonate operon transcriptional repressor